MRKFGVISLLFTLILVGGCGKTQLAYSQVDRDVYNTGGNLTFSYDDRSHTAYFGGENEVIQYYAEDIAKGWRESGNRIGLSLLPPKEISDYKSGYAEINGEKILAEDFFKVLSEDLVYAEFQPIVSKENLNFSLNIVWQEGMEEQIYNISIDQDTIFMER